MSPILRKEREANIDVVQSFPLQKPADSDWRLRWFQFSQVKPETKSLITGNRSSQNIIPSVVDRPHSFVTDELQERRLIKEIENKLGIFNREPAQRQPICLKDFHRRQDDSVSMVLIKEGFASSRLCHEESARVRFLHEQPIIR